MKILFLILLFALAGCSTPEKPPPDRSSAAYAGKVPKELRRAVRVRYAEDDFSEPTNIMIRKADEYDTFLIIVSSENEPDREFLGSPNAWRIYPATPMLKGVYGF